MAADRSGGGVQRRHGAGDREPRRWLLRRELLDDDLLHKHQRCVAGGGARSDDVGSEPGAEPLRAGVDPVDVQMNSTVPSSGRSPTRSPSTREAAPRAGASIPSAAGITQLQIVTPPAGFSLPMEWTQITATVTAPDLLLTTSPSSGAQLTSVTVGDVRRRWRIPDRDSTVAGRRHSHGDRIGHAPARARLGRVTFTNVANAVPQGPVRTRSHGGCDGRNADPFRRRVAGRGARVRFVNPAASLLRGELLDDDLLHKRQRCVAGGGARSDDVGSGAAQQLRAGVDPVDVQMNSTVPSVGTITNPSRGSSRTWACCSIP